MGILYVILTNFIFALSNFVYVHQCIVQLLLSFGGRWTPWTNNHSLHDATVAL